MRDKQVAAAKAREKLYECEQMAGCERGSLFNTIDLIAVSYERELICSTFPAEPCELNASCVLSANCAVSTDGPSYVCLMSYVSASGSSAPYYYGQLKGGKKPPTDYTTEQDQSKRNGCGNSNQNNNNHSPTSQFVVSEGKESQIGHTLTDESPSSSSSHPSSSRDPTYSPRLPPPAAFAGPTFANPLLEITPDTRSSESLTRISSKFTDQKTTTVSTRPPPLPSSSSSSAHQQHPNQHFYTNRQGIYQKSLSLLSNGVSPLLRKKSIPGVSSIQCQQDQQQLPPNRGSTLDSAVGLTSRRRSDPVMFAVTHDSIANGINRMQDQMKIDNMNLDFGNMLLSDEEAYCATASSNGRTGRTTNVSRDVLAGKGGSGDYGRSIQMYKDSFYMMYGEGSGGGSREGYNQRNPDENIYEEVDPMNLHSLRAQYADTLSLQSWKKKGSKRALSSAASSSFSRWFSTRKKSPLVGDEESAYMDVKMSKKQRPPISLPEFPPEGLTQEQLKRRYILSSIVESENSYINSLHRLINEYKKPLEDAVPAILSQNKINIIFYRLEQILQCHAIFGIALNQCVREWDQKERIGDVFLASFSKSMVLDIYSDFINNFTNAMETARKASKSKSAFAQFLQEKSLSSPDRLSFFGLMVKPVQRFPQFILLLNDLLKHTPSDHPDRMKLQLALTQLESLADRLNERKRDAERHFAVKQLLKDYLSSATSSPNRYLLRMDEVFLLDLDPSTGLVVKTKCRKLYLLNDMLVCVSLPSERLKFAVNLQEIDVVDDVTPASNNLVANSALKTKDSRTGSVSPQSCTLDKMYTDIDNLMHDMEMMSRITNLVSSLRYQYNGLTPELMEQINIQLRNEIRRKDAQIMLIDRSCFNLRIRSKNYKDVVCVQMNDPEAKKDWLTDVRLAKLALDRSNNPAWDVLAETASSGTIHAMTQHRLPLFVKSLPIFATSETSKLTCALFYQLGATVTGGELVTNVLWICNVNQSGSQLGALSTNGADVSLIHSYELCDSQVTCLESVGSCSVWIGLKQGRVIVIDAASPGEWHQLAALEVAGEVVCMKHFGQHVYVGLITGQVCLFDITQYQEPVVVTLSASPVSCIIPIGNEVYATSHNKIWVLKGPQIDRSHPLSDDADANTVRPNLLAHCGIGLWVSMVDSSVIKLYHTETFKHLSDLDVAINVKRVLPDSSNYNIVITSMLATRGLLWIGTNVGVIVTLNLPRLRGVPLVSSGAFNVALHRHLGPVTILLNLTPGIESNPYPKSRSTTGDPARRSLEVKNEDIESIYGLYSDLMKVGQFGVPRRAPPVAATVMNWDLTTMAISDESTLSESASNGQIYQDGGVRVAVQNTRPNRIPIASTDAQLQDNSQSNTPSTETKIITDGQTLANSNPTYGDVRSNSGTYGELRPLSRRSAGSSGNGTVPAVHRRETLYSDLPLNGQKTALLITGGNGFCQHRRNAQENPYSSQHAHCIIWEYKLS